MVSDKTVCPICGKVISKKKMRRHRLKKCINYLRHHYLIENIGGNYG